MALTAPQASLLQRLAEGRLPVTAALPLGGGELEQAGFAIRVLGVPTGEFFAITEAGQERLRAHPKKVEWPGPR